MKKIIAWVLLLAMCLGVFAGCKEETPNESTSAPTESQSQTETTTPEDEVNTDGLQKAAKYLKALYNDAAEITAKDFTRTSIVPVGKVTYNVTWSVDVAEDLVKIVVNSDNTVTVDVNEEATVETPYVLTATVSDAYGNTIDVVFNHILPAAFSGNMVDIVLEAYKLESGETMPYEVTLTGVITMIDTPYSADYKNITVTIAVPGAEEYPIMCYRLTGTGADTLKIGDTITVTGTIKNYNGTIEFDAGCILDSVIAGEAVDAPTDMKQIVDEAYALAANTSLPYEATLTGTITAINTGYSAQYGNISVTIVVEGREDYPIVCYRMKGDGIDQIGVNDVITVTGYITNYVGTAGYSTIEFTAGCQLVSWTDYAAPEVPTNAGDIVKEAYALGANETLSYVAKLTGKITKVGSAYDANYGNITVTIVVDGYEDYPIVCYRMSGDGVDQIEMGDTITVEGYITNYVGESGYSTIEYSYPTLLSYTKNTVVAPTDDVKIVEDAYKLGDNEQLPYKATLTGVITSVKTPYNSDYDNVSVVIEVPGAEDKPILCYRLKGDGADKIGVGDTITVSGYITNYVGESGYSTIEFVAGCTLDSWVDGVDNTPAENLTTPEEIVNAAYALEDGEYLQNKYTLTGVITKVNYAYDSYYNNITVTIVVGDMDDMPIMCYRLKGDGADKIGVGDTITVTGSLCNYSGTIEFTSGCTLDSYVEGEGSDEPVVDTDPEADTELTIEEAIALGASKDHNNYTTKKYYVTGVITEVYNTTYGNMKLTDENGNILTVYGTYSADGTVRYDSLEVKPEAGDTVTVYGIIGNYNGAPQMKNGWITEHTPADDETDDPETDEPEVVIPEAGSTLTIEEAIALGAALDANAYTDGKYYVTGVITEVYNTTYGNMKLTDENGNILTVYGTYSADGETRYDALETQPVAGDTVTVYGIIGNYNGAPQMKNGWITAHTPAEDETDDPETDEPEVVIPEAGATLTIEEAIALGAALDANAYTDGKYYVTGVITEVYNTTYGNMKLTDENGNILTVYGTYSADGSARYDALEVKPEAGDTVTVYGIIGNYNGDPQMKNGWITEHTPADDETDEPETDEPEVVIPEAGSTLTIEEAIALGAALDANAYTDGKYYVTGVITEVYNTTYGNMKLTDENGNVLTVYGTYSADGSARYDALEVKPEAGDTITVYGIIGNYNGDPQMKNGWITAHTPADDETDEPEVDDPEVDEPEVVIPEADTELTIEEAIALGASKDHNTYTEGKYYVTGVITEVYNTTYGNMYIKDENGNVLTVYGTYSADGETRYDALETQPVAGDTVTVYGIIGQFNGTPQMKNGWITEHIVPEEEIVLPNLECAGWWSAHTEGLEIKADSVLTITFVNTTNEDATGNWNSAVYVFYTGTENKVNGEGYTEYHVQRSDNYGWGSGSSVGTFGDNFSWDTWLSAMKAGAECELTAYIEGSNVIATITSDNIVTTVTIPVTADTPVYVSLTGEYTVLSEINASYEAIVTEEEGEDEEEQLTNLISVADAIAMGAAMDHGTATAETYTITGVIDEVTNTKYGNMYVVDSEGNKLFIYGVYDADGNRYDALETQPVAGDTVTLCGVIGNYNGAQMQNAVIVDHTPAE